MRGATPPSTSDKNHVIGRAVKDLPDLIEQHNEARKDKSRTDSWLKTLKYRRDTNICFLSGGIADFSVGGKPSKLVLKKFRRKRLGNVKRGQKRLTDLWIN